MYFIKSGLKISYNNFYLSEYFVIFSILRNNIRVPIRVNRLGGDEICEHKRKRVVV